MDFRSFNCKDGELPVMCGYVAFSLKRDAEEFNRYSPKFNAEYIADFETKTSAVSELLSPVLETAELKGITTRMYAVINGLLDPLNRVKGYLKLAKDTVPVSATDFGLTLLRKKVSTKDAKGILQGLQLVNANLQKYKEPLSAQGLTEELISVFTTSAGFIAADNQKPYEIVSRRKDLVRTNVGLLNDLYKQLSEIMEVGKILYKGNNIVKLKEYTFSELLKKVRIYSNPAKKQTPAE
jgi:hypothetical protein